tara:strand:- start:4369 stop:7122 length:2754 start_codon:yes stop_codon:yes gene_type:complete
MANALEPNFEPSASYVYAYDGGTWVWVPNNSPGAVSWGYTPYPRSNVEKYWVNQENPPTQLMLNAQFGGSASYDDSWGVYQITNPSMWGANQSPPIWDCSQTYTIGKYWDCCKTMGPGVSYNTKMLVVWNTYDALVPLVGNVTPTPIFYQASASGTAPCDEDYNNYGSYPWGSLQQLAYELCPWNFTQSLTQSTGQEPPLDWQDGITNLLWDASRHQTMMIFRNNDVRGITTYGCTENVNPRLLNCWPLSASGELGYPMMFGLAPCQGPSDGSPYSNPFTCKWGISWGSSYLDCQAYNNPNYSWSLDPAFDNNFPSLEVETSESFFYGNDEGTGYYWECKPQCNEGQLNGNFTGSCTIEFLIKPSTSKNGGPQIKDITSCINGVGGVDYLGVQGGGGFTYTFMPVFCNEGAAGYGGVFVDSANTGMLAFCWQDTYGYDMHFTSSANLIINDPDGNDTWFHCAVTRNFDADKAQDVNKWFINGIPVYSSSFANWTNRYIGTNTSWNIIAADKNSKAWGLGTHTYYSGSIGFIRVYHRALNQYEIRTNFYKAGIWCNYEGYHQDYTYPISTDFESGEAPYELNGGIDCQLQVMVDHGNLVSDMGMPSADHEKQPIYNIRRWKEPNTWSGSHWPISSTTEWTNNMFISQSTEGYQTYDSMNGARYYPGSNAGAMGHDAEFAHEYIDYVYSEYIPQSQKANAANVFEGWFRLAPTLAANKNYTSTDKVIMCYDLKAHGKNNDWGIMYNQDGIGFWDGDVHFGIPLGGGGLDFEAYDYIWDRWVYLQAVFPTGRWNDTDQGTGCIIGLNGQYWSKTGNEEPDYYTLTNLTPGVTWNTTSTVPTSSINIMGQWEGTPEFNASGSVAEIRYYSHHLRFLARPPYALETTSSIVYNQAEYQFDWLRHNWNANKVRFGMGGDKSWT